MSVSCGVYDFQQVPSQNSKQEEYDRERFTISEVFWSVVPLRIKVFLGYGLDSWENITHAILNREQLWKSLSQPMHPVTLEFFESVSLERSYQVDWALRCHKHVPIFSLLLIITPLVTSWMRFLVDKRQIIATDFSFDEYMLCDPLMVLPAVAIIQYIIFFVKREDTKFLVRSFSYIQLSTAAIALSMMIFWMYFAPYAYSLGPNPTYSWPFEESALIALTFSMLVGFINVSWTQFLVISMLSIFQIFSLRWLATQSPAYRNRCWFNSTMHSFIFLLSVYAVIASVKYTMERLMRKDFVLSHSLVRESERTERLLRNVLPPVIADKLKFLQSDESVSLFQFDRHQNQGVRWEPPAQACQASASFLLPLSSPQISLAERLPHTSIVHIDVVNFTAFSAKLSPAQLVQILNSLFTAFDCIAQEEGLEKIKTVGDAYVAAAGAPEPNPFHAFAACRFGLKIVECVTASQNVSNGISVRVGIDSGTVVGGIVGNKRFQYELWGSCVEGAREMEEFAPVNRVRISDFSYSLIKDSFECTLTELKGMILVNEFRDSKMRDYRPKSPENPIKSYRRRFSSSCCSEIDRTDS